MKIKHEQRKIKEGGWCTWRELTADCFKCLWVLSWFYLLGQLEIRQEMGSG